MSQNVAADTVNTLHDIMLCGVYFDGVCNEVLNIYVYKEYIARCPRTTRDLEYKVNHKTE
jgi:hypothetical protein